MTISEAESHYRRLVSRWFEDTFCITWTHGLDVEEVAAVFDSGIDTGRRLDFVDAMNAASDAREIAGEPCSGIAGRLGRWTVTIEPKGYKGSLWETMRTLSEKGTTISVLYSWNAQTLDYTVHGEHIAGIDLFETATPTGGSDPHRLDPHLKGLSFDDELSIKASSLVVCERITGERLDEAWLARKHRWMLWEDLDSYQ
ncbi:hypothetical protein HNP84_001119 [Thermocatellispora tengchongensis]|uniref:Uncharacterized protein n=1 Tax=Thermocatellispora tengchongensis TaxID=1073253 RepID=A0A840P0F7_9ACTN|nr:DUF6461 domain-containing protein [Thermocatellispora tengchongensis]MBB5131413.1 hypothetical protein [Thermocatellispora tengchongensis]